MTIYRNQNGVVTQLTTNNSMKIENVGYGDSGTEPANGLYTLSIGSENYYVPTIDMDKDDQITLKIVVPQTYASGKQLSLRIGCTSAGSSVTYTFDSWGGLLYSGDVVDTSIPVETASSTSIAMPSANALKFSSAINVSDADGKIGGILVSAGDIIVFKIERTNVNANAFRVISMELEW